MLAMQYTIRLANEFDLGRIKKRVAKRRHLFDDLPGLTQKSFLVNAELGTYAPFYVWSSHEKARQFLLGDLFSDVIKSFGRPRVRLWGILYFGQTASLAPPTFAVRCVEALSVDAELTEIGEAEAVRHAKAMATPGLYSHAVALDADRWEIVRYSLWQDRESAGKVDGDCIDTYDVLYVTAPGLVPSVESRAAL